MWCCLMSETSWAIFIEGRKNQLDRSRENWSFRWFLEYLSLQVSSNGKGSTTGDFHFSLFPGHFQEASIVLHKEIVYDILSVVVLIEMNVCWISSRTRLSNYDGSSFVKDLYVSMISRMTLICGVQKLLILCVDMNSIIYNMWGLKLYIVVNLEMLHFFCHFKRSKGCNKYQNTPISMLVSIPVYYI